jgi:2-polyprenyl-3-methyl-5-hydroxy-6-metoxy-1,4-benzoquinol methylase
MLEMLKPMPGMSVCDFGSGCGLTSNALAKFGCIVTGYEPKDRCLKIARKFSMKMSVDAKVYFY